MSAMTTPFARRTLRLEALLVLALALSAYQQLGASWLQFAVLFVGPDLALLGYVWGPRTGAWSYNATHGYAGPLLLGLLAQWVAPAYLPLALIWVAHIAMDRALGYGLKSAQGFTWTHLGRIGRNPQPE